MLIPSHSTAELSLKTFATLVRQLWMHITKPAFLTSSLLFTSYFRSPQLAETCDESHLEVSSLVTLLSSVSNWLPWEFASPRLLKFRFQTSHQQTMRVLKIQNGRHKTQHMHDKGKLIFCSYSNQMWGLPVHCLSFNIPLKATTKNGIGLITTQCLRKDPVHTCTPNLCTREVSGNQAWKQKLNERVSFIITSSSAP